MVTRNQLATQRLKRAKALFQRKKTESIVASTQFIRAQQGDIDNAVRILAKTDPKVIERQLGLNVRNLSRVNKVKAIEAALRQKTLQSSPQTFNVLEVKKEAEQALQERQIPFRQKTVGEILQERANKRKEAQEKQAKETLRAIASRGSGFTGAIVSQKSKLEKFSDFIRKKDQELARKDLSIREKQRRAEQARKELIRRAPKSIQPLLKAGNIGIKGSQLAFEFVKGSTTDLGTSLAQTGTKLAFLSQAAKENIKNNQGKKFLNELVKGEAAKEVIKIYKKPETYIAAAAFAALGGLGKKNIVVKKSNIPKKAKTKNPTLYINKKGATLVTSQGKKINLTKAGNIVKKDIQRAIQRVQKARSKSAKSASFTRKLRSTPKGARIELRKIRENALNRAEKQSLKKRKLQKESVKKLETEFRKRGFRNAKQASQFFNLINKINTKTPKRADIRSIKSLIGRIKNNQKLRSLVSTIEKNRAKNLRLLAKKRSLSAKKSAKTRKIIRRAKKKIGKRLTQFRLASLTKKGRRKQVSIQRIQKEIKFIKSARKQQAKQQKLLKQQGFRSLRELNKFETLSRKAFSGKKTDVNKLIRFQNKIRKRLSFNKKRAKTKELILAKKELKKVKRIIRPKKSIIKKNKKTIRKTQIEFQKPKVKPDTPASRAFQQLILKRKAEQKVIQRRKSGKRVKIQTKRIKQKIFSQRKLKQKINTQSRRIVKRLAKSNTVTTFIGGRKIAVQRKGKTITISRPKIVGKGTIKAKIKVNTRQKTASRLSLTPKQTQQLQQQLRSEIQSSLLSRSLIKNAKKTTKSTMKKQTNKQIPKIPVIPASLLKKKLKSMTKSFPYNVYVKEKGGKRFFKANKTPLGKRQANALGAFIVDNSSAATFRTSRISKKKKINDIRKINLKKFRRPKRNKKSNLKIEKNRFRIDSRGELRGITAKGLIALRQRKKSKKRRRK